MDGIQKVFLIKAGSTAIKNAYREEMQVVLPSMSAGALMKKKRKFSPCIRKFRVEQLQSHISLHPPTL